MSEFARDFLASYFGGVRARQQQQELDARQAQFAQELALQQDKLRQDQSQFSIEFQRRLQQMQIDRDRVTETGRHNLAQEEEQKRSNLKTEENQQEGRKLQLREQLSKGVIKPSLIDPNTGEGVYREGDIEVRGALPSAIAAQELAKTSREEEIKAAADIKKQQEIYSSVRVPEMAELSRLKQEEAKAQLELDKQLEQTRHRNAMNLAQFRQKLDVEAEPLKLAAKHAFETQVMNGTLPYEQYVEGSLSGAITQEQLNKTNLTPLQKRAIEAQAQKAGSKFLPDSAIIQLETAASFTRFLGYAEVMNEVIQGAPRFLERPASWGSKYQAALASAKAAVPEIRRVYGQAAASGLSIKEIATIEEVLPLVESGTFFTKKEVSAKKLVELRKVLRTITQRALKHAGGLQQEKALRESYNLRQITDLDLVEQFSQEQKDKRGKEKQ